MNHPIKFLDRENKTSQCQLLFLAFLVLQVVLFTILCFKRSVKKKRKKNCSKDLCYCQIFLIISCHIPHSKFVLLIFKITFLLARISCCNFFFLNHLENFFEGVGTHVLLLKNFFKCCQYILWDLIALF